MQGTLCRLRILAWLDKYIEHISMCIDHKPKPMLYALD
ncbi:hypothetical protein CEV32_4097 [Brucella rhizosphaerae]|uniref:Uncharacterized protein n=1 Tax=Brucella rhizosphaerae TaxID=571254 RepID=A0A256FPQ8_9HYPH|nr:hypothetical protein CEV32_4097 [Brucella rhizosphaerae]